MDDDADLVLVVSNTADATADFFEQRLADAQLHYLRLDTDLIPDERIEFLAGPSSSRYSISVSGVEIQPEDVGAVYYRRPVPPQVSPALSPSMAQWAVAEYRQAWGGFLRSIDSRRWMNHPTAITNASYKPEQLRRAQGRGLRVPRTLITTSPSAALEFCSELDWHVVAKPVGHGELLSEEGDTEGVVYTNALTPADREALDRVRHCPTLFQERIDKRTDVRVNVTAQDVVTVRLHSQERAASSVDCRRDNMAKMRYSIGELPRRVADAVVSLTTSYGLRFGALDLVEDTKGQFWFLELNPAGQWAWLEEDAGAPVSEAIIVGLRKLMRLR